MKKIVCLLFLAIPFLASAQAPVKSVETDSLTYYQSEIGKIFKVTLDSIKNSAHYQALVNNIKRLRGKSNGYAGFVVFADIVHSNFNKFNSSIVQNGFSPMNAMGSRFGFGFTSKTNKTMFDFYFETIGFNNTSSKGNATIKSSLSNIIQFDLGYDLLKSKIVSVYPYGGFSLRGSSLDYSSNVQTNSSYSNITNIITNNQSVVSSSIRMGYQAGLGFDFTVSNKKNNERAVVIFTKIGTNGAIGVDKYKIEGIDYKPGIKQGDWLITVGVKFVRRH